MNFCTCGKDSKRKIYTQDCLVCGKPIVAEIDQEDIYRFRAECLADVAAFFNNLWPGHEMNWVKVDLNPEDPACMVTMSIPDTDLEEIRLALSCGRSDGNLMMETLNHAAEFTGERWFDLGQAA